MKPSREDYRDPCRYLSKKYIKCLTSSYLSSIDINGTNYCGKDKRIFEQCLKKNIFIKRKKILINNK